MTAEEPAPAKVNLHLHVTGRRADGLHLLDSLVVFPAIGDRVEAEPASALSLALSGPFGPLLGVPENLALRAAEALQAQAPGRPGAAIMLEKNLPPASGIGGGSADAGAVLRLLNRMWGLDLPPVRLARLGEALGADVPVCAGAPRAAVMQGIGERLSPAPALPPFWLVLCNPGRPLETAEVFRRLERRDGEAARMPAEGFASPAALAGWLDAETCNMLEPPAVAALPVIGEVRQALAACPACLLARMSGSGATCFGMFGDAREALAAADAMRARGWWAAAGPVEAEPGTAA